MNRVLSQTSEICVEGQSACSSPGKLDEPQTVIHAKFEDLQRITGPVFRSNRGNQPPKLTGEIKVSHKGITAVLGRSGTGKTTLLDYLSDTEDSFRGTFHSLRYVLDGKLIEPKSLRKSGGIAYLNKDAGFLPWASVRKNLLLLRHLNPRIRMLPSDDSMLHNYVERLGMRPDVIDRLPHELSFGMMRRLLILRCFLSGARFLFLDEVLVGLDPVTKIDIVKFVATICESANDGTVEGVIIVTHDAKPFIDHLKNVNYLGVCEAGKVVQLNPNLTDIEKIY